MVIPGVNIETLMPPQQYSPSQLDRACAIAHALGRGKLVLCAPPENDPAD